MKEREGFEVEIFPIFGKPAAAIEPGDGAFDNPAFGKNGEAFGVIRTLDDL